MIPALHDLPRFWSWEDLGDLRSHDLIRIGLSTSPRLSRGTWGPPRASRLPWDPQVWSSNLQVVLESY